MSVLGSDLKSLFSGNYQMSALDSGLLPLGSWAPCHACPSPAVPFAVNLQSRAEMGLKLPQKSEDVSTPDIVHGEEKIAFPHHLGWSLESPEVLWPAEGVGLVPAGAEIPDPWVALTSPSLYGSDPICEVGLAAAAAGPGTLHRS